MKRRVTVLIALLALSLLLPFAACTGEHLAPRMELRQASDHFDGEKYFNPGSDTPPPEGGQSRSRYRWLWRWVFGDSWPEWPEAKAFSPGPPPPSRVPREQLRVTPVGHATFLVQMDGLNILFDPIWSERCSPVSWAGPRRYKQPGIRFEDLPPIDVVLVTHNHYDHLDLPTLERLSRRGTPRALTPLGNAELIREAEIPSVVELDWWESVPLSPEVTVTLVPAQHFSARTPWDRNRTLWGAFVLSGPSGNLFHAGDTGYGPHFKEISRRFSPIRMALLPISPFRTRDSQDSPTSNYVSVHMGPAEAVQAHVDLGAQTSLACHYQVFQLGTDGFDDAVNELAAQLKERNLPSAAFITPLNGRAVEPGSGVAAVGTPVREDTLSLNLLGAR
ncbi:MAG: MBL fold metallo-hydrolase [Syntrophales bacterium]